MSDGKQKFKVGDRVEVRYYPSTLWLGCGVVDGVQDTTVYVKYDSGRVGGFHERYIFPIASPIRTVTRREIVPGKYGIVEVGRVGVYGVPIFVSTSCGYSAEQLREAAHLFNQLAEVLEEDSASVKVAA